MEHLGGSRYRLSTGREIDANKGIIGLSEEPHEPQVGPFSLYEGYDGPLAGYLPGKDEAGFPQDWTPEELAELADFMIAQWQRFKDAATKSTRTQTDLRNVIKHWRNMAADEAADQRRYEFAMGPGNPAAQECYWRSSTLIVCATELETLVDTSAGASEADRTNTPTT